ncbi:hypothetical protein [Zooshikella sp. RANM57]|uniref:hypothetical protein n=1 Tax=Zooshikella sp. RANM57 TaxID=3425863 RepID=UPI003D6F1B1D
MTQEIRYKDETPGVKFEVEVEGLWGQREIEWIAKSVVNLPMSDQEVLVAASNKIRLLESLREKNKSWLGRLSNWLVSGNTDEVETNGRELGKLYELAEEQCRYELHDFSEYMIEYNYYKQLVIKAASNVNKKTK